LIQALGFQSAQKKAMNEHGLWPSFMTHPPKTQTAERSMFQCLYTCEESSASDSFYLREDDTLIGCVWVGQPGNWNGHQTAIKGWNLHTGEWTHTLNKRFQGWIVAYTDPCGIVIARSGEASVEVWDVITQQPCCTIADQGCAVDKMAVSRAGQCLVGFRTTSQYRGGNALIEYTGTVWVWDLNSGRSLYQWTLPRSIRSVAVSADGRFVAAGDVWFRSNAPTSEEPEQGSRISVWDVYRNEMIYQWVASLGSGAEVSSIAFSPDGQWLVASIHRSKLKIWNLRTGEFHGVLPSRKSYRKFTYTTVQTQNLTKPITFTPDGQFFFSPDGTKGVVKLWHIPSKREVQSFASPITYYNTVELPKEFTRLQLLPATPTHPAYLMTDRANGWNIQTREPFVFQPRTTLNQKFPVHLLMVAPDQKMAVTTTAKHISVWDVPTGQLRHSFTEETSAHVVTLLGEVVGCFGYRGAYTENRPGYVHRWNWQTGEALPPLPTTGNPTAMGKSGVVVCHNPEDTEIWSLQTATRSFVIAEPLNKQAKIFVSDDGSILIAKFGERFKAWNLHTQQLLHLLPISGNIERAVLSTTGRCLVYRYFNESTLRVLNVLEREEYRLEQAERLLVWAFSQDEQLIVGCSPPPSARVYDNCANQIRVWEAQTGRLLRSLTYHPAPVTAFAISPNGGWIVSADLDGNIKLGNLQTGAEVTTLTERAEAYYPKLAVTDDRMIIVVDTKWIKVWGDMASAEMDDKLLNQAPPSVPLPEQSLDETLNEWLQTANNSPSNTELAAGIAQFEAFMTYFESLDKSQQQQLEKQIPFESIAATEWDISQARKYILLGEQAGYSFDATAIYCSDKWDEIQVTKENDLIKRSSSARMPHHGQEETLQNSW
jgi:WD40 repeat protein